MSNYLQQLKLEAQERAKWKEVDYSDSLWESLIFFAEHVGDSLHCTEWKCNDLGVNYRLVEWVGGFRSIEVYYESSSIE